MWIKRTDEELVKIKAEARQVRFWLAVAAGVFFGLIAMFFHRSGWTANHLTNRVSPNEIPEEYQLH